MEREWIFDRSERQQQPLSATAMMDGTKHERARQRGTVRTQETQ
jgi:hypothetical protein